MLRIVGGALASMVAGMAFGAAMILALMGVLTLYDVACVTLGITAAAT